MERAAAILPPFNPNFDPFANESQTPAVLELKPFLIEDKCPPWKLKVHEILPSLITTGKIVLVIVALALPILQLAIMAPKHAPLVDWQTAVKIIWPMTLLVSVTFLSPMICLLILQKNYLAYDTYLRKQISTCSACPAAAMPIAKRMIDSESRYKEIERIQPIWNAYMLEKANGLIQTDLSCATQYAYRISSQKIKTSLWKRIQKALNGHGL